MKKLGLGTMTPEAAVAAIDADLLDTYQSKLDAELTVLKSSSAQGLDVRQAESAAMVQGYWAIVAPPMNVRRANLRVSRWTRPLPARPPR